MVRRALRGREDVRPTLRRGLRGRHGLARRVCLLRHQGAVGTGRCAPRAQGRATSYAATPDAAHALWRYLGEIDLVRDHPARTTSRSTRRCRGCSSRARRGPVGRARRLRVDAHPRRPGRARCSPLRVRRAGHASRSPTRSGPRVPRPARSCSRVVPTAPRCGAMAATPTSRATWRRCRLRGSAASAGASWPEPGSWPSGCRARSRASRRDVPDVAPAVPVHLVLSGAVTGPSRTRRP